MRRPLIATVSFLLVLAVFPSATADNLCRRKRHTSQKRDVVRVAATALRAKLIQDSAPLVPPPTTPEGKLEDARRTRMREASRGLRCLIVKALRNQLVEENKHAGQVERVAKPPRHGCPPKSCVALNLSVVCDLEFTALTVRSHLVLIHEGRHTPQPALGSKSYANCQSYKQRFLHGYYEAEAMVAEMAAFCALIEWLDTLTRKDEQGNPDGPWRNDDALDEADEAIDKVCDYFESERARMARALALAENDPGQAGAPYSCTAAELKQMADDYAAILKEFNRLKTEAEDWLADYAS
jgi:hypothetical protein